MGQDVGIVSGSSMVEGQAVISRLPGAVLRALLVVWMVATPALLLPELGPDATEVVALIAIFAAVITCVEYASNYPSLIEFRHAPPFNRVRFISLFITVFLLTVISRGTYEPTAITEFVTAIGTVIGHAIDFPYSPVRNMVLTLPPDADVELINSVRTAAGLSYLTSLVSLAAFVIVIRIFQWPGRYGTFNVWINLPTFDPTAGGDVVERLQRDARFNVALGFLLPFVIPAVLKVASETFDPISLSSPQTLIWMMTAWAFLPSSLFMRGIAMGRVAQMIEDKRRQRYAEFGEEGALA
ncbi:MAG: hypothetical protein AAGF13_07950 [Pseudomonadota bacterium]